MLNRRRSTTTGGSGVPTDAHYLTTQAEAGLSAERNLGALTSGLLKIVVADGEATPGTAVAADLPTGIDAAKLADGSVSNAEFETLDGVTSGIQAQLNNKAANWSIQAKDTGGNLAVSDSRKIITVQNAADQVLNLPVIAAGNVGTEYVVVKLGAGRVTLQANSGQYVADSSAAGTIFNKQTLQTYAVIHLVAVSTTVWIVTGIFGTWETA